MQPYPYDDQDPSKAIKLFRNFGPEYFHYLNYKESSGHRDTAVSSSGALGAMQMKPIALKQLQKVYPQLSYIKDQDLVDKPELNMKLASAYLDYIGDGVAGYYKRRGVRPPEKIDPGLILVGYRLGPTALTDVLDQLPQDQWNYHGVRNAFVNDRLKKPGNKAYTSKEKDSITNYWDSILFHGKMLGGQKEKWRPELRNIVKNPSLFQDGGNIDATELVNAESKPDYFKAWLENLQKINEATLDNNSITGSTGNIANGTPIQTPTAGEYLLDDQVESNLEYPKDDKAPSKPGSKSAEFLAKLKAGAGLIGDYVGTTGIQQGNVLAGGLGSAASGFAKAGIPGAIIQGGFGAVSALQNKANKELAMLEAEQSKIAAKNQGRDMGFDEYGRMYKKGGITRNRITFRPDNRPLVTDGSFRITGSPEIDFGFRSKASELDMEDEDYGGDALKYYDDRSSVLPAGLAKYHRGLGKERWDSRAEVNYGYGYNEVDPDPSKSSTKVDTIYPNSTNAYLFDRFKKDGRNPDYVVHTTKDGEKEELSPIQKALKTADDILSAPSRAMVKGITGKYQDPSEAWGYKDPKGFLQNIANIGIDMVADPMNLIGVGLIGKGSKVATKGTKTLDKAQVINDAIKIKEGQQGINKYEPHYSNGDFTVGPILKANYKPSVNKHVVKKRLVQANKKISVKPNVQIEDRKITQVPITVKSPKRDTTYWKVSPVVGKTKDSYQLTKSQFEELLKKSKTGR